MFGLATTRGRARTGSKPARAPSSPPGLATAILALAKPRRPPAGPGPAAPGDMEPGGRAGGRALLITLPDIGEEAAAEEGDAEEGPRSPRSPP